MNDYERMRLSERYDEDAAELADYDLRELIRQKQRPDAARLREQYKEFYSDIKLSQKEDW